LQWLSRSILSRKDAGAVDGETILVCGSQVAASKHVTTDADFANASAEDVESKR